MTLFERAVIYIRRKRRKNLVLFLILLLISTMMLTGLSIRNAIETASYNLRQSLGGSFSVTINKSKSANFVPRNDGQSGLRYVGKPITDKIIKQISSTEGISDYNAIQVGNAIIKRNNGTFLKLVKTNSNFDSDRLIMNTITAEANTKSKYSSYFKKGAFKLIEGTHITGHDKNAALISKELAKLNHLKIGDKVRFTVSDDKKGYSVPVKIKGIFEIAESQGNTASLPPPSLYQNRIFIDNVSGTALYAPRGSAYNRVDFYVYDPAKISHVIEMIKGIKAIPWNFFSISVNDTEYQEAERPLNSISVLIGTLLLTVTISGVAVLSLLLTLWMKSRIHETGILLSIGIQKSKIILQHIVEILALDIMSFSLSLLLSAAIVQQIGNLIIDSAAKQGGRRAGNLSAFIPLPGAAAVFVLCALVAVAAVAVSNITILRLKPKNILTKMSA